MADPCFCALELVAARAPAYFRYYGYECTDDVVTAVDVLRVFPEPMANVAPSGTQMPALNDPCSCGANYCQSIAIAKPEVAAKKAAALGAPTMFTPCDDIISANLDILGRWNARSSLYPNKLLRLTMVGRHEQCHRFKVLMWADLYDAQCPADGIDCFIDECDLELTRGGRDVWIGNVPGKQIGPFQLRDR